MFIGDERKQDHTSNKVVAEKTNYTTVSNETTWKCKQDTRENQARPGMSGKTDCVEFTTNTEM